MLSSEVLLVLALPTVAVYCLYMRSTMRFRRSVGIAISGFALALVPPVASAQVVSQPEVVAASVLWEGSSTYGWLSRGPFPPQPGWLSIDRRGFVFRPEFGRSVNLPFIALPQKQAREQFKLKGVAAIITSRPSPDWDSSGVRMFTTSGFGTFQTADAKALDALIASPPTAQMIDKQYPRPKTLMTAPTDGEIVASGNDGPPTMGSMSSQVGPSTMDRFRAESDFLIQKMSSTSSADSVKGVAGRARAMSMSKLRPQDIVALKAYFGIYPFGGEIVFLDPSKSETEEDLLLTYAHELWHYFQYKKNPEANALYKQVPRSPLPGVYGSMDGVDTTNKKALLHQAIEQQAQEFMFAWQWMRRTTAPGMTSDRAREMLAAYARIYPGVPVMVDWLVAQPVWGANKLAADSTSRAVTIREPLAALPSLASSTSQIKP